MARKSMPDDARLWELKAQLHDVEARLQRDQSERKALEEEIARQRERIRQDQARAADALERNVAAQWESGRSVTQIATSLARSRRQSRGSLLVAASGKELPFGEDNQRAIAESFDHCWHRHYHARARGRMMGQTNQKCEGTLRPACGMILPLGRPTVP